MTFLRGGEGVWVVGGVRRIPVLPLGLEDEVHGTEECEGSRPGGQPGLGRQQKEASDEAGMEREVRMRASRRTEK
jgi:hypothetical protein